jgi:hypothetical protein
MSAAQVVIEDLRTPRLHVAAPEFAEHGDVYYGLGFHLCSYRGERVVWHRGVSLRRQRPEVRRVALRFRSALEGNIS